MVGRSIDILVNSAELNRIAPFADIEPADFQAVQDINRSAPMLLCQAVLGKFEVFGGAQCDEL